MSLMGNVNRTSYPTSNYNTLQLCSTNSTEYKSVNNKHMCWTHVQWLLKSIESGLPIKILGKTAPSQAGKCILQFLELIYSEKVVI